MTITRRQYDAITLRVNALIMAAQRGDNAAVAKGWDRFIKHLSNVVGVEDS